MNSPIGYNARVKKYWKRLVIVLIVLLVAGLIYRSRVTPPSGMTTTKVVRQTLVTELSANGKLAARQAVDLKFNLPGKLAWVGVSEGQEIKKYQAVAAMDRRLLQKDLENSLSLYKATLLDFETTHNITYKDKVVTDLIQRELDKSQFGLDRAVLAVEVSDIAAREATLVSPIAGTVIATHDLVAGVNLSGADLEKKTIRVADLNTLYFAAELDEVDFGRVILGQEASVSVDAYPGESCQGEVSEIGREGQESTGGVVTIPVKVRLRECKLRLIPGLNGEVRLVTGKTEGALVVPKKYVSKVNGEDRVWVMQGGKYSQRESRRVTVGASSTSEVQITDGVAEGETVMYIPAK